MVHKWVCKPCDKIVKSSTNANNFIESYLGLKQFDTINKMVTLSLFTISGYQGI